MATYLVERYVAGLTAERVRRFALATSANAFGIRHLGSALVPGDGGSLCLFEAESSHALERANRLAEAPYERVVQVVRIPAQPASGSVHPMQTTD